MSEIEDSFADVQEGMGAISAQVTLLCDGGSYKGVVGTPDLATQMLTGGYQGRAFIVVRCTREQFGTPPTQRGDVLVKNADGTQTAWQRKDVGLDEVAFYVFNLMRQIPSP